EEEAETKFTTCWMRLVIGWKGRRQFNHTVLTSSPPLSVKLFLSKLRISSLTRIKCSNALIPLFPCFC
ncbi:predicted protein, partial [Arabidopsis lyrata subsp. lyrata]